MEDIFPCDILYYSTIFTLGTVFCLGYYSLLKIVFKTCEKEHIVGSVDLTDLTY